MNMEWTDTLATGSAVIDAQHRALFKLVNELQSAAAEGRVLLTFHAINQLTQYVRLHFATEEHLMKRYGFPNYQQHVEEHRVFAQHLQDLMIDNTREDTSAAMVRFLSRWLVEHIARSDMEYVAYFSTLPGAMSNHVDDDDLNV